MFRAIIILFAVSTNLSAANLGNYGAVFDVGEVDFREVVANKLNTMRQDGTLSKAQEKIKEGTAKKVFRPTPTVINTRKHTKVHYVDPSIVIRKDIYNEKGQLLAKKGQVVNPFERVTLSKVLVFLNMDDDKQVKFAQKQKKKYPNIKYILTGGSVKEGQDVFGRVYFDINGELSSKLKISHTPSIAEQDGINWKITEAGVEDE